MDESLGFSGTFERPFRIERLVFQRRKPVNQGSQVKDYRRRANGVVRKWVLCVKVP